ncbi:8995_t:CDS:2 [Ambispora leptoticha]|uniref:8995_t:CDS:1 n=1 Tax=Ambispora leptoticha TaxID=144679 RepID=A0A9N9CCW0_9GLOM|nr:8995_t:CDS:2 [Ambispora leptoticha]
MNKQGIPFLSFTPFEESLNKKKRKREQPKEIVFDETARKEFLTGFHKRKLERRAKAQEYAKQQAKREHVQAVKEQREARQKEVKERLEKLQAIIDETYGMRKESGNEDGEDKFNNNSEDITDDDIEEERTNNKKIIKLNTQQLSDTKEYKTRDTLTTVTIVEDFEISNINYNDNNTDINHRNKHNATNIEKSKKSNKKFTKKKIRG